MAPLPELWIGAAAEIAATSWRSTRPLDLEVAEGLKRHRGLDEKGRGFVAETVAGMARARRFLERAGSLLPFEPTREAICCLHLLREGVVVERDLPADPRLRRALGAALAQADRALAADPRARLAEETPAPRWLVDRLAAHLGDDEAARLCRAFAAAPPLTLRANTLRVDRDELQRILAEDGVETEPCALSPAGLKLLRRAAIHRTRAWREGLCEVQDEGSQLVAPLTGARPGQLVVDGCAGAGGKTLHLAALMRNKGMLYAFDKAAFRLEGLRRRARRADVHNVRVHPLKRNDAREVERLFGKADAVLVDAPCSGSGVLRRAPDIGWRLQPGDVQRLVEEQGGILDAYAPLPKPGGRLVYATCSLLPEENAAVADAFLARHPEYRRLRAADVLAQAGAPVDGVGDDLALSPSTHGTDGFFAAVFERG